MVAALDAGGPDFAGPTFDRDGKPSGIEPATSGDDMRHALELAVALRESARRGGARVELPLIGALRHARMLPEFGRWNFKKKVHGEEWYRKAMNTGQGHILVGAD